MNARELYHTARRTLTTVHKPDKYSPKYYVSRHNHTLASATKQARKAILAKLERQTLPRGKAPLADAITRAVYYRGAHRAPSLKDRLQAHVAQKCRRLIEERGGETEVGNNALTVIERRGSYTLLAAEGWREYSRQFGNRHASLAYLCGHDDNGPWAARVPSSVSTVIQALDALIPAEVKRATEKGRKVLRQGDVFVVERKRDGMDSTTLPAGHTWHSDTRTLHHDDGHNPLHVPFPAIAVQNKALLMGRRTGLVRSSPSRAFD
jgi:hypothetical protein